jgi:hypothetical protein
MPSLRPSGGARALAFNSGDRRQRREDGRLSLARRDTLAAPAAALAFAARMELASSRRRMWWTTTAAGG